MPDDKSNLNDRLIEEITFLQRSDRVSESGIKDSENPTLQRLKAVELLNKSILETSLECIISLNHRGDVLEFNFAAEKTFGFTRNQMIGKPLADFIIPPRLREAHIRGMSRYLATHQSHILNKRFEFSALRSDGIEISVELTVTRLPIINPPIFMGYLRDITHRKNAEEALEKGEKRFRSLIENSFDMIVVVNSEGMITYATGAFSRILGYSKAELIGRNAFDLTYLADKEKAASIFTKILRYPEEPVRIELRAVHKDGSLKWVEISGQNLLNDPAVGAIVANIRDISERKLAEESFRKAEEKYRIIINNAVEGIFQTAPDGSLVMVNPAYAGIFGYDSPQEMMNAVKDISKVYVDPEQRTEAMRLLKEQGILKAFEAKAFRRDGKLIWFSSNARAVRDAQDNLLYIEGSLEDITRRKELEGQILQAQKLESLGILAGGIAHDFNNILTAILGNISLAKSLDESKEQLFNRLTEAEIATLRASELARQLLTFSKGGAPIKKLVSIQSVIEHSVQFALSGSNIQSQFFFQEGLWPVEIDEGQIGQVVQNLVINAQQAMPSGGTIRVEAKNLTINENAVPGVSLRKGDYLFISVQDKGTGISKEHLSKIFDPYFTTKQKGSGLGLSITYSIIQRHHGYITVESNPGVGTTFFIYLPASSKALLSQEKLEVEAMTQGKARILVMDDEEGILRVAEEILKSLGYETDLAKNGTEAVVMYKKAKDSGHPFDLVITDLTVPGDIGGVEILRRLKEIDPQVKVIVSSGYFNDPAMADFKGSGFSDCLIKPYRSFEISGTVKRVLKAKRAED
jgi:PAS domain S-box-containing protein